MKIITRPDEAANTTSYRLKFIEPMYASVVKELPEGKDWLYEVTFDGYRYLAVEIRESDSGLGEEPSFPNQFPQIAQACEQLPPAPL